MKYNMSMYTQDDGELIYSVACSCGEFSYKGLYKSDIYEMMRKHVCYRYDSIGGTSMSTMPIFQREDRPDLDKLLRRNGSATTTTRYPYREGGFNTTTQWIDSAPHKDYEYEECGRCDDVGKMNVRQVPVSRGTTVYGPLDLIVSGGEVVTAADFSARMKSLSQRASALEKKMVADKEAYDAARKTAADGSFEDNLSYDELYWKYVYAPANSEYAYFQKLMDKVTLDMEPGNGSWVHDPDPYAVEKAKKELDELRANHKRPLKSYVKYYFGFVMPCSLLIVWIGHMIGVLH